MTKGLRSKRQEDKNLPTWRRKGLRSKRREEISFITFIGLRNRYKYKTDILLRVYAAADAE